MNIDGIILSILSFLGIKTAEKVFDAVADPLINHKSDKKRKEQLDEIQKCLRESNSLLASLTSESSLIIRDAINNLRPLIETLQVRTAHEVFDNLRLQVKAEDKRTLSRIDYYRGCCSKYDNKDRCIDEYNLAYQEMIDSDMSDPEIIGAKIYVHCCNKNKDAAIPAAEGLKAIDRANIWAWVPTLLFSDNFDKTFSELPDDIDVMSVLAHSCMLKNGLESLGIDIETYKVDLPSAITFENIAEWVFDISVLMNRYFQEWNKTALLDDRQPGEACVEFNSAVIQFNKLLSKTQLGKFVIDLDLWYLISQYQISHDSQTLHEIKVCDCGKEYERFRILAYVLFLVQEDRYQEAKSYLSEKGVFNDISILNTCLLLAIETTDADYAETTLRYAIEYNVEFNIPQIVYLFKVARLFPEKVKPFLDKIRLPESIDSKAVRLIISYFVNIPIDVVELLENLGKFSKVLYPHIALVLVDTGYGEDAIRLCEQVIPQNIIDFRTYAYIEVLQKSPQHTDKLYKVLGDIRRRGFTGCLQFLRIEYSLALRVRDTETMYEVSEILYSQYPSNVSYFLCYISAAINCQKTSVVKKLANNLNEYEFDAEQAMQVFNVLFVAGLSEQSVEFLYNYIQLHPSEENLNLLFHDAHINRITGEIINKEYDSVFDGAYVHYLHNGIEKASIVTNKMRLKVLIGKTKGETVVDTDRMSRRDEYKIIRIHNKYLNLIEKIWHDISEGKYTNAISYQFSDEEMKDGSNILDVMHKMIGRDESWFRQRDEDIAKYKKGELIFAAFLDDENLVSSIYEHLFGSFKIYGLPHIVYDSLHGRRKENVDKLEAVLDLPALILLFEIHLKFKLTPHSKYIIPNGVFQILKATLAKEIQGSSTGVYNKLAKIQIEDNDTWMTSRLRQLLDWIGTNVKVEKAVEILNVEDRGVFSESDYLALFYESLLLAQRGGRLLISIDQCILKTFAKFVPVSDVNAYLHHFFPDEYKEVCRFFVETSIIGGEIDVGYIIGEYNKYVVGQISYFRNCMEYITVSQTTYEIVMDICIWISEREILTQGDNLIIDSLLKQMFELFDSKTSVLVLGQLCQKTKNANLRERAKAALLYVHPLSC